ncbi:SfiI-subtelomeric fragment related protein family member, putative [Theileria annulata]|uniref:SfiI-subtelomeric related protein family member, putative n=1 Tax=Theileria annulata TaxID=5874 RepID=Q4U8M7_THEAN|nr:SfiI-subtelomeric fragment related protein family member, putative [Theileria annulata]CAI76826.1 SfiI-subtelomeric fragment related protein family member, putative [Theileria annulata]
MSVNNGIPNSSLKYLHLVKPIVLDIRTETSTDEFKYTEDQEKRKYTCYKGYAVRRLIDSTGEKDGPVLMWEAGNSSHYAFEILKFGNSLKTREVCLCLVNGDYRIFAKRNGVWTRNDKITLDIGKSYSTNEYEYEVLGSETSKTNYTALEFEAILNASYYTNYVATFNHLFNKIVDSVDNDGLGTVIWEANNPFECAKDVSLYSKSDKKYLGILLVNYNYILLKWSPKCKNWVDITDSRVNLSNFKYRTEVESAYNYIQDISFDYKVSLYYMRYCISFVDPNPENSEKVITKCLIYDLIKNIIKVRYTNGKSVSVDLDDTEIKLYHDNNSQKFKKPKYMSTSSDFYPNDNYYRILQDKTGKPITLDISNTNDKNRNYYKFGEISKFECKKGFKFTKIVDSNFENSLIWSSENNEYSKEVILINDIKTYLLTLTSSYKCLIFTCDDQNWENISHLGIDLTKFKFYDNNYNLISTCDFDACIKNCDCIITFNVDCHMVEYENIKLWSVSENSDYVKLSLICINILINRLNIFFLNHTVRRFIINNSNVNFISEDISTYCS